MSIINQPNLALAKIRQNQIVHAYVLGNFASPRHVDLVCLSGGFDVLWFDLEHFDIPTGELATMNLVAKSWPVTSFARAYIDGYQTAARLLETGIGGLMCSMVESEEHARSIVEWTKFNNPNPQPDEITGLRGWNGGGVDARYGKFPAAEYVSHQNNQTAVLIQIETPEALKEARKIVKVPGVDGLFFGPGDYAHRLGHAGQHSHPKVREGIAEISKICAEAGKWWGTVAPDRESYLNAKQLGAKFISPGGDVKVFNNGLNYLRAVIADEEVSSPSPAAGSVPAPTATY
jgi:4-hydroxy-2-oxoheptanedioate aldolase